MFFTYMLECRDGSIYTGFTNNLVHRMKKHCEGTGARYTRSHKPAEIGVVFQSETESCARKLEHAIKKRLNRQQKIQLIQRPETLTELLPMFSELKIVPLRVTLQACLEDKI